MIPEFDIDEYMRQTEIVADAIREAILSSRSQFNNPILNAELSALSWVCGYSIATIDDAKIRKYAKKVFDAELRNVIKDSVGLQNMPKVKPKLGRFRYDS